MIKTEFEGRLSSFAVAIEERLQDVLSNAARSDETVRPERLMRAMRHAVLAGGKRLRPFLLVETAQALGREPGDGLGDLLYPAAALELIHCYSLVHDDLPAMDDDDVRRGRPTVHKAFDDATAILTGDALQTLAFDLVVDPAGHPDATVRCRLASALARASGLGGMVGGQVLDLAAEGRFGDGRPLALTEPEIRRLQAMKTGALIRFACDAGGLLAGAAPDVLKLVRRYGEIVGLAFQLSDDLLDVTGDAVTVGKATAKDATRGKGTLVSLNGVEAARAELAALVREAEETVAPLGTRGAMLAEAARFVARRQS
ncbi:polyprenyl synthetase family protein [Chthonobacter albigriseus]|uniref:polyprenyl synthetase family protein n=1 Tax=Chthonobacter albigriseus TaxID=1683161 RepID=UPI0015EF815C|nr:farnesyl diphosphate synthase [Chthonobacter albigriseus]